MFISVCLSSLKNTFCHRDTFGSSKIFVSHCNKITTANLTNIPLAPLLTWINSNPGWWGWWGGGGGGGGWVVVGGGWWGGGGGWGVGGGGGWWGVGGGRGGMISNFNPHFMGVWLQIHFGIKINPECYKTTFVLTKEENALYNGFMTQTLTLTLAQQTRLGATQNKKLLFITLYVTALSRLQHPVRLILAK